ncbi:hypothetical protein HMPREF3022_07230 [Neisseria sp. HMSC065C04]|jgi:hypothetical protein|uniref:hypothetical protein n=1 Tax=Neisseria sp. HMSC065C04 TaxID=1739524 RepID=UPI00066E8021|nr:hypothetical protein [Neisseria sp. HMSC065C04]OFO67576.1 hypothetical protein HMPREF3022_07230 [Neisseria sp. HMSC065C04]
MDFIDFAIVAYLGLGVLIAKRWVYDAHTYGAQGRLMSFLFVTLIGWPFLVQAGEIWIVKKQFLCIFNDQNGKNIELTFSVSSEKELFYKIGYTEGAYSFDYIQHIRQ